MERSNSTPSTQSASSKSSSAPFAYQTRLLERTSSTRSTASVSRTNSILTNPTGGSTTGTRRWTPSHRVTNSLDVVRGKWEERSRDAAADDISINRTTTSPSSEAGPSSAPIDGQFQRTPVAYKRRTLPSPIIATPLSPNTTGITVEGDSLASDPFSPNRIHLPSLKSTPDSPVRHRYDSWSRESPTRPTSVHPPLSSDALKPSSVMTPSPYRSSYMQKKSYGENFRAGRKLGSHLPRIASGDGQEEEVNNGEQTEIHNKRFARRARDLNDRYPRLNSDIPANNAVSPTDVVGIPGRVRFSRDVNSFPVPAPSSRLVGGLWADVQRHLLQAYEYLCHVGEAQQWIEGCLNEELGFGVVEMEDGLRNGVVLAKLVRHLQREPIVRKIYEVLYFVCLHTAD